MLFFSLDIFSHDSEEHLHSLKLLDCKLQTQHIMESKYLQ